MPISNGIITAPVSIQDVQTAIGDNSIDLSNLCKSVKINKWSKMKPVIKNNIFASGINELAFWWRGDNGMSGFNIPVYTSIQNLLNAIDTGGASQEGKAGIIDWDYIPPTGGQDSAYRLADFNNYNHAAYSIFESFAGSTQAQVSAGSTVYGNLITRGDSNIMIWYDDINGIINSHAIDLKNWRFGIAIRLVGSTGTTIRWKTAASPLRIELPIVDGLSTANLPVGSYYMYPFFCNGGEYDSQGSTGGSTDTPSLFIPVPNISRRTLTLAGSYVEMTITAVERQAIATRLNVSLTYENNTNSAVTISGAKLLVRFQNKDFTDAMVVGEQTVDVSSYTVPAGGKTVTSVLVQGVQTNVQYRVWFSYSGTLGTVRTYMDEFSKD